MRRLAALLTTVLLVAGCGDDTADPAPPDSTTTTSTSSSSTTAPPSTTPSSTTPTSTTAPPSTTPSTTTPSTNTTTWPATAGTDEYTIPDMQAQLAGSHTYLSGWTVTADYAWGVDQWGRGVVTGDISEWYTAGGEMEIWVSELLRHDADGLAVWRRTDVVVATVAPRADRIFSARCRIDGESVDGLFGLYRIGGGDEPWPPAVEAWRIDFSTGRARPIDTAGVDCENPMVGL